MGVNSETLRIFGTSTTGGKDELKTPNQSTGRHRKLVRYLYVGQTQHGAQIGGAKNLGQCVIGRGG